MLLWPKCGPNVAQGLLEKLSAILKSGLVEVVYGLPRFWLKLFLLPATQRRTCKSPRVAGTLRNSSSSARRRCVDAGRATRCRSSDATRPHGLRDRHSDHLMALAVADLTERFDRSRQRAPVQDPSGLTYLHPDIGQLFGTGVLC